MKAILWIGAGVLAGYLVWWVLPEYFREKEIDPRSQQYLRKIAAELNRSLPTLIDKDIELTTSSGHQAMLIYSYRLVNHSVSKFDHQKFAAEARDRVIQAACSRPETRDEYLKKGVTLRYSYFDKDQHHVATFDVTNKECGV